MQELRRLDLGDAEVPESAWAGDDEQQVEPPRVGTDPPAEPAHGDRFSREAPRFADTGLSRTKHPSGAGPAVPQVTLSGISRAPVSSGP